VRRALRVLIADDHAPTRAGVRAALERDGCSVCAEAATADAAIEAALRERPDACVVDLKMPGGGIRVAREISARLPGTPVVVLTVSHSTDDLLDALRAGAAGYLLKDMDPAELPAAVQSVVNGEARLSGALTAALFEEFRNRIPRHSLTLDDSRRVELTDREWDVLELLGHGATTAAMAERLCVSQVTVRRHVSTLLHKLKVSSREEAQQVLARQPPRSEA
jgi:DNA-binding NarL/FixJ family response regulator